VLSETKERPQPGKAEGPVGAKLSEHLAVALATDAAPGQPVAPRIVAFFCTWCTYTAADMAGLSRMTYSSTVRVIRIMCSGRLDPQFVVAAFRHGADGVLIGGCHPGDCHYQEGNYKALRRVALLRSTLRQLGVEDERLRLEWISASEGEKVQRVCNEMAEQLRRLGPLRLDFPGPRADQVQGFGDEPGAPDGAPELAEREAP
jgi:F420-non-reducing hydrogenase iron-sulfur subunit